MFLAKVLHRLQLSGKLLIGEDESLDQASHQELNTDADLNTGCDPEDGQINLASRDTTEHVRNLSWLIQRLSRLAKYEAGHHPKESLKVTVTTLALSHSIVLNCSMGGT